MEIDYTYFMTTLCKNRTTSPLRQLFDDIGADPEYVLMAGGLPNEDVFPIKSAVFKLRDGSELEIDEKKMAYGLQYGITSGNPKLHKWMKELITVVHDPPVYKDPSSGLKMQLTFANGAQDCLYRVAEAILEAGDTVLVEEYAYSGFASVARTFGCNILPVKCDHEGLIPDSLEQVLSEWSTSGEGGKAPGSKLKAIYLVPNGGNPTGSRYTEDRKRKIYKLTQEYNFMIIEDDAYYFLEERPLLPSLFSMDVDGRVLRLDTFSKTVAPGLRIGCVSGPKPLVDKIILGLQASTQGCSGVSQIVLLELLTKLGIDGFLRHCEEVAAFYDKQRNMCLQLVRKHLTGLADWEDPTGGMFVWLKLKRINDSRKLVMETLLKRKVAIFAGSSFLIDISRPSPYVRISYTMASEETMEKGLSIIAEELRKIQE